jgi:hypothetical protein
MDFFVNGGKPGVKILITNTGNAADIDGSFDGFFDDGCQIRDLHADFMKMIFSVEGFVPG